MERAFPTPTFFLAGSAAAAAGGGGMQNIGFVDCGLIPMGGHLNFRLVSPHLHPDKREREREMNRCVSGVK